MKQKRIRVLKVEPGKEPTLAMLNNNLDDLQKAVSISTVYNNIQRFWSPLTRHFISL